MKTTKMFMSAFIFALLALALAGAVSAACTSGPVCITSVEVNDREVKTGGTALIRSVDRGDEISVLVEVEVSQNLSAYSDSHLNIRGNDNPDLIRELEDLQVEAVIRGYDGNDFIQDVSDAFNAQEGVSYVEDLKLQLPYRLVQDRYSLQVRVSGRQFTLTETYNIEVEAQSHSVIIKDAVFSRERTVMAGRAFLATVRVQNVGNKDENNGIKVRVSIPELGISASDYIDELSEDESTTSEELYMRIPEDARKGEYRVIIEATYDDGDETVIEETSIFVTPAADTSASETDSGSSSDSGSSPSGAAKTIISIGPEAQDVARDKGAVYPVTLMNQGRSAKTYTITTEAVGGWADTKVSPSSTVVAQAGESKALFIFVTPKDTAAAGEQALLVSIMSDGETLKQVILKGNVVGPAQSTTTTAQWGSLKKGLEIGFVVLVVLLVILALIIGFNKLKGEDEDEGEGSQTYY